MKYSIYKAAKSFYNKELHKQVNFKTISAYLQKIGYAVVFYSSSKDNDLLIKYDLVEYSKTVKAFTIIRKDIKVVFVDDTASCEHKLISLLHETAHIILDHINKRDMQEFRLQEMEADAFAYTVLNPPKSKVPMYVGLSALCISLAVPCINAYNARKIFAVDTVPTQNTQILPTSSPATTSDKVVDEVVNEAIGEVLVTPTGKKYHLPNCRYVKNKHCATLTIAKAQKKYAPCLVCEPDKDSYWQN